QNEAVYEIEQPVIGQPNPAIDSRFEYASRAQRTRAGGSAEERTAEGPVIFPMKLRTPLKLSERNFKRDMMMKSTHDSRILVTGAAGAIGAIGRNLTAMLLAKGREV